MSTTLTRPALFGYHSGVVRRVALDKKGNIRGVTMQMHGGDFGAKSLSARYRGKLVALTPDEVSRSTVFWHGKVRPVKEFLGG
jgi:hypothetical protein